MHECSLTPEQVRLFRHNGFLKLPSRLPEPMVEALKEAIWGDIHGTVEPVVRDRRGRVVRISNILERTPVFRQALTCAPDLEPLESPLGPNLEPHISSHNHAT